MINEKENGFTVDDLEIQKLGLQDRIKRLEQDLQSPLDPKFSEQAVQTSNFIFMRRLLEVERANLRKLNFEIEKKRQQVGGVTETYENPVADKQ
jgi:hypothetical protein